MIESAARNVVNRIMIRVVYKDNPSVLFFPLFYKSTRLNFNVSDFIASYSHVNAAINTDSKRRMEIARSEYAYGSLIARLASTYTYLALAPRDFFKQDFFVFLIPLLCKYFKVSCEFLNV